MASPDEIFYPYKMGGNDSSAGDQMICTAMKILLCPPHEGVTREYHELPQHQQNQVWSDLTGSEAPKLLQSQESIGFINQSVAELRKELNAIRNKPAYEKALQNFPHYVDDKRILLRFLRAARFDFRQAAERLVAYFEQKLALFGPEKLGREILLSDLDADDMNCMDLGYLQVLTERDFSGRPVLFFYKAISDCYRNRINILRVAWYIFNIVALEETAQKLGIINVVYNLGGFPDKGIDYEKSRRFGKLLKAIPLRVDGMFVCLDEAPWERVVHTFSMLVDKFLRIRLRALPGSHQECMYQLSSIGVPCTCLPVNENNELLLDNHRKWLNEQHRRESIV